MYITPNVTYMYVASNVTYMYVTPIQAPLLRWNSLLLIQSTLNQLNL